MLQYRGQREGIVSSSLVLLFNSTHACVKMNLYINTFVGILCVSMMHMRNIVNATAALNTT